MVVAGGTTAVLGRTMAFTTHADRVRQSRFRRQHFLDGDAVLPVVTEVIGVHRLCADLAKHVEQQRRALVADGRQAREPVVGIWFPEPLLTDAEVMHVTVLPPHGQLQHVVQLLQGHVRGHQYAYTLDEILAFLGVLPEPAATIFATAAFAGLRRGEIRGLRWEDPCASEIRVVQARQYVCALSAALRFPLTRCALAATINYKLMRCGAQTLLSSSMAEHPAVNRRVVGSSPT